MKNYLALLLAVFLVLGFAASAFAIHAEIPAETTAVVSPGGTQITIGGEVRVRGDFEQSTADFNSSIADHPHYYDERVRLSVDAKVTPNTEAMIQLESTNENTASASADLNIWGNYNAGGSVTSNFPVGTPALPANAAPVPGATHATGLYQAGNAQHDALSILQAWILHSGTGLFGVPAGVKVGHMPLALGNGLFFDHTHFGDDAVLFFVDPVQDLHIVTLDAKFRQGASPYSNNNNADAYVFLMNYAPKDWSASFDATYVNDQNSFGVAYVNPSLAENSVPILPNATFPLHFWNFGLRGNGTFSGFTFKVDGELQAGSVKNAAPAFNGFTAAGDADFKGWAILASGSYKLDPVTLTLEGAYGSGLKKNSGNVDDFVTSLGADQHFTYVYDYRTVNACGMQYGGLCNTWYVKLGGQADLTKDVTSYINLFYLGAVEDAQITLPVSELMTKGTSKDIGFEIDAKVNYKIDRNLQYWVEGGYLFAGGFFDTAATATQPAHSADGAWGIRHGIQLNF
ncbi:MAG TPA: hypothetical protein DCP92_02345 [Nitrospiraceae bacterium]|nr:hypothetical protein [Nitrospiraceae bacterium]